MTWTIYVVRTRIVTLVPETTAGKRFLSRYPMVNVSDSKIIRLSDTISIFSKYLFSERNISFDKIIFVSKIYSLVERKLETIEKSALDFLLNKKKSWNSFFFKVFFNYFHRFFFWLRSIVSKLGYFVHYTLMSCLLPGGKKFSSTFSITKPYRIL